jgi:hypothetical protein
MPRKHGLFATQKGIAPFNFRTILSSFTVYCS